MMNRLRAVVCGVSLALLFCALNVPAKGCPHDARIVASELAACDVIVIDAAALAADCEGDHGEVSATVFGSLLLAQRDRLHVVRQSAREQRFRRLRQRNLQRMGIRRSRVSRSLSIERTIER